VREYFGGYSLTFPCTKKNYNVVRRATRVAARRVPCEMEVECQGRDMQVMFACDVPIKKAIDIIDDLLERAIAEGVITGPKRMRGMRGKLRFRMEE
jgi:hypothetical protein